MASNFGKLDVVKYLLRSLSVDVNKQNNLKRTALFIAAINGHIDVVNELINHSTNTDIEAREEDGMTPLLGSCHSGEMGIVKFLFDKGANLMAKTNDETNCLILAAGMLNPRKEMESEMLSPYGKGANGDKIRELMNINEVAV